MSCLTYLESSFPLRGYLGVDIFCKQDAQQSCCTYEITWGYELFDWAFGNDEVDLNEALLQASDEFEITPRVTAPSLSLAPSQAPSTTGATCCQPNPLYLPVSGPIQASPIGLHCKKHHRGSTEIRTTLLTNQIAVFESVDYKYI